MEKNLKSKIIFIISMVIFGTIAVFVKAINVSSGEIALYRAILAALIIGLYLLITKQRIQIKEVKKDLALIAISGMLMGFNWIFLFEAYKYTTVSVSTLAYYFAPIIVMIVCPLLLKEKLTKKQIICFILSTIGRICFTSRSFFAPKKKVKIESNIEYNLLHNKSCFKYRKMSNDYSTM